MSIALMKNICSVASSPPDEKDFFGRVRVIEAFEFTDSAAMRQNLGVKG